MAAERRQLSAIHDAYLAQLQDQQARSTDRRARLQRQLNRADTEQAAAATRFDAALRRVAQDLNIPLNKAVSRDPETGELVIQ